MSVSNTSSHTKKVSFSCFVDVQYSYSPSEYDRSMIHIDPIDMDAYQLLLDEIEIDLLAVGKSEEQIKRI